MRNSDFLVIGSTGLVGRALTRHLRQLGASVLEVHSANYDKLRHSKTRVLINCNGSSSRFVAAENPQTDFDVNVQSVKNTLFDFECNLYIYCSTVDVYPQSSTSVAAVETANIESTDLHPYGFHKWLAEKIVKRYADNYLILRLGTVVGPNLKKGPIFDIFNGDKLFLSSESILTFIHTDWIARAVETLSRKLLQREVYNVTGCREVPLEKLLFRYRKKGMPIEADSDKTVYKVSTDKMSKVLEMPDSEAMVTLYAESATER